MSNARSSLPTSIAYLVVGLAFTITCIYSLLVLAYSWLVEDNIFNRLVAVEVTSIQQHYARTGHIAEPKAAYLTLHHGWQTVPQQIREGYLHDNDRIEYTLDDGRTYHLNAFTLAEKEYVVLADVAGFEVSKDYLPNLIRWMIGLALICCAVVSVIAFLIARRLTLPIKTLAGQVQRLTPDQKPRAFSHQYPDNELKQLASVVERSFSDLQAALEREKHFTRDVSHEIRTPISVIKNALDGNRDTGSIDGKAYEQVARASLELEQVTSTLLALARSESTLTSTVSVNEILEHHLLNHYELNNTDRGRALQLEVNLDHEVLVVANPNLLHILFNNILANIVHYASAPMVAINLTACSIEFINQTADPIPDDIQLSGVKGARSQGIGQGLSLIERICQLTGWHLTTASSAEQFRLVIAFRL